jgi:hypothetical protein
MSKMAELEMDIYDMLAEGETPVYISKILDVPINWVYEVMELDDIEELSPFATVNS